MENCKQIIDDIFEADAAGWTIEDIANGLGITKQKIIEIFLRYQRYEINDDELKEMQYDA
jgi:hypothetical protein